MDEPGLGDGALARLTDDIAVQDFPEPTYNDVLWWHVCAVPGADPDEFPPHWVSSGLGKHEVTGSVASADLTISPSILCMRCQRHGFVTAMAWRDA